jgi:hypothetical protein
MIEKEGKIFPGLRLNKALKNLSNFTEKSLNVWRILLKVAQRNRIDLNYRRNIQE